MKLPFAISSVGRSGTNFLLSLLGSTKLIGTPWEMRVREPYDDSSILNELNRCYEKGVSDKGDWGVAVLARQFKYFSRWLDINKINLEEIKWIWLVRRDKFAQAISLIRATQTGVWHLRGESKKTFGLDNDAKVDIKREDVYERATNLFFYDQQWESFFYQHKIAPYKLYYEDFVDESTWGSTVTGVLDYLEVSYQLPLDVSTPLIKLGQKQNHSEIYKQLTSKLGKKINPRYLPFDYES